MVTFVSLADRMIPTEEIQKVLSRYLDWFRFYEFFFVKHPTNCPTIECLPYMKLKLLNNAFIIFDNCAFKIQNSKKKPRILDSVLCLPTFTKICDFLRLHLCIYVQLNFPLCRE